jgi:hypothetical protein
MLLPSILSIAFPAENPSPVRTGGALTVVMLIAAFPLQLLSSRLLRLPRPLAGLGRWPAIVVSAVLLSAIAALNYHRYFVEFDLEMRRHHWNTSEMGAVVRRFVEDGGELRHAYHVPYPFWADTRLIGVYAGDITWPNAVGEPETLGPELDDPSPKLFLLHPDDQEHVDCLRHLFPAGVARRETSALAPGKDFIVFSVPAT